MHTGKKRRVVFGLGVVFLLLFSGALVSAAACTNQISFSGSCQPDGALSVYVNNSLLKEWTTSQIDGGPCASGTYSFIIGEECNIHSGETLDLYLDDVKSGSYVWMYALYNISLDLDASIPIVTLTSPTENVNGSEALIDISFIVQHNSSIRSCSLYVDDQNLGSKQDPPTNTTLTFNANLTHGTHTLYVSCENTFGNTGTSDAIIVRTFIPGTLTATWVSPASGLSIPQLQSFIVETSVTCSDGDCGEITAGLDPVHVANEVPDLTFFTVLKQVFKRFFANLLKFTGFAGGELIKTTYGATPFYTLNTNPVSCGHMEAGDTCNSTWTVVASGTENNYTFFTMYNSSLLSTVNTPAVLIAITENNDSAPPTITLTSPAPSGVLLDNQVTFEYMVSDDSNIFDCQLFINNNVKETDTSVQADVEQFFLETLPNGLYNWAVSCTDNSPALNNITTPAQTFTVNGSEQGVPLFCDTTITSDKTLYENMQCNTSNGLIIGANDITLNCNGHEITGNGSFSGIVSNDHTGITLSRCNVQYFDTAFEINGGTTIRIEQSYASHNRIGLLLNRSSGNNIYRLSAMWNTLGMYGYHSDNTIFEIGNIHENEYGIKNIGNNDTFSQFTIVQNNETGMHLEGNNNLIMNNSFSFNRRKGAVILNGSNNKITLNQFASHREVEGAGLYIEDATQNEVSENTFEDNLRGLVIRTVAAKSDQNKVYHNTFKNNEIFHAESTAGNQFDKQTAQENGNIYYQGNSWDDIVPKNLTIYDLNGDGYGDGGDSYPYDSSAGKVSSFVVDRGPQPVTASAPVAPLDYCQAQDLQLFKQCGEWGSCVARKRQRECWYTNGCSTRTVEDENCVIQPPQPQAAATVIPNTQQQGPDTLATIEEEPAAARLSTEIVLLIVLVFILLGVLAVLGFVLYKKIKVRQIVRNRSGFGSGTPKTGFSRKPGKVAWGSRGSSKKSMWNKSSVTTFRPIVEHESTIPEPVLPLPENTEEKGEEEQWSMSDAIKQEPSHEQQPEKKHIPAPTVTDKDAQELFNKAYAALGEQDMKQVKECTTTLISVYQNAKPEDKHEIFEKLSKLYKDVEDVS